MGQVEREIEMAIPKVKAACVSAVMQKAAHSNSMGGFAIDWLKEFCVEQPALAAHLCGWIEHFPDTNEEVLTSMTAMVGILVKSIESQIEADQLIEELG